MDDEQYMKEMNFQTESGYRYDASGVLLSANVRWSDNGVGVYTVTSFSPQFKLPLEFNVTHTGRSKRVSQPARTLNSSGDLSAQPPLTVTDI